MFNCNPNGIVCLRGLLDGLDGIVDYGQQMFVHRTKHACHFYQRTGERDEQDRTIFVPHVSVGMTEPECKGK